MPWPATVGMAIHGRTISPYSPESVCAVIGGVIPASATWQAAQTALYIPFRIAQAVKITGFFWMNGATASGNVDCGVMDEALTKITSTGAIAQSGTNTIQSSALGSGVTIPAGIYYLAIMCTSATATIFCGTALTTSELRHIGVVKQVSVGATLPATGTFTAPDGTNLPLFGLYSGAAP